MKPPDRFCIHPTTMHRLINTTLLLLMSLIQGTTLAAENTVQSINQQALRCITNIKAELVVLSNRYPALRQVGTTQIDAAKPASKSVSCRLTYWHQVHLIDGKEMPDDNGVLLMVGIREHMPTMPTTQRHRVTFGKIRVTAYYRLELGKDMKGMEAPVQAVVEKHLRQFRDQVERMK